MADYASLSELKSAMRITDNVDDTALQQVLTSASRFVDQYCQRDFTVASGTATRDYVPSGRWESLPIDDATSIVSVKIDEDLDQTFSVTLRDVDFQPEPVNRQVSDNDWAYTRLIPIEDGYWPVWEGRASVRVTGTFGWEAVPDPVKIATILHAQRIYTRFSSPVGVVSFGDMGAIRVSRFVDRTSSCCSSPTVGFGSNGAAFRNPRGDGDRALDRPEPSSASDAAGAADAAGSDGRGSAAAGRASLRLRAAASRVRSGESRVPASDGAGRAADGPARGKRAADAAAGDAA